MGGGLLGSHLALRLAAEGHPTTVYSRSFNPLLLESAADRGIRLVEGSVELSSSLADEVGAADLVLYTAGSSTPAASHHDPAASVLGSVAPAVTMLELVRRAARGRLVLASSGGTIYGCPTTFPTPEDAPLEPISVHGLNAVAMERYAQFFADRHSLDVVVLRYSNLYGPGQLARRSQGVISAWSQAIMSGEPVLLFGDGSVRRDFIYVEDAAAATLLAAQHPAARGAYNVGTGHAVSLREVLNVVELVADRPVAVETHEGREIDVPIIELDCSRIRALTGWVPTTELSDGVAASWAWLSGLNAGGGSPVVEPSAGTSRSR
ncbi:MAG TPA: NAD-dependent epimerase/dehydratase family protein [Solirubrobacterales bacterium]|nr:NAD-dependent epimerase/dehydratase family protein [Solirubrobacterales bacterium]